MPYEGKAPSIKALLGAIAPYDAGQGVCPMCGHKIEAGEFDNELAVREYRISGMCQQCQYDAFSEPMTPNDMLEYGVTGRLVKSTDAWWEVISVRKIKGGVSLELENSGGILQVGNDQRVLVRDKE